MRDGLIPPERVQDPVGKRFPAVGRDPERTPMQWDGGTMAGFTTASDAWLPLAEGHQHINVSEQRGDPRNHLGRGRRRVPASGGEAVRFRRRLRLVEHDHHQIFRFVRRQHGHEIGQQLVLGIAAVDDLFRGAGLAAA